MMLRNTDMELRQLTTAIIFVIFFEIEGRLLPNSNCGRLIPDYNPLIVRGFSANKHWPWHAAIYHEVRPASQNVTYKCGGTVISPNSVLTAAHCVCNNSQPLNPAKLLVVLGKFNLSVNESSSQSFKVN